MTDELKDPTYYEQHERPAPDEKEEGQRDHNQRNTDAVRKFVQWMLVLRSVVGEEVG